MNKVIPNEQSIEIMFGGAVATGSFISTLKKDGSPCAVLTLQSLRKETEVGPIIDPNEHELVGPRVNMVFTKVESIDVALNQLSRVRKHLVDKLNAKS